jgi:molybdopterin molybdotransferase
MTASPIPERFKRHALQPEEAQRRLLARVGRLPAETVALSQAWRRRLAEPIAAPHPFPPFRRSGMDGYAVRAEDVRAASAGSPVTLEVLETLPGGTAPTRPLGPGQASRIMTGGMLPEGADAVVMLEMTDAMERGGKPFVKINKSVPPGENMAGIGSEIREGELLLEAGRLVGPGEAAVLAACGYAQVSVFRKPKVAVLSTGSELLEPSEPLAPGKIRNSNAPMLEALIREAGAEPVLLGKVPDDADEAEALILRGLEAADLMVTTGGVSVGDYDILVDILARWDGETLFNKIAMRPGSPTTAAVRGGRLLLALSGNPGACFVGFHLFALPALRAMQGVRDPLPFRFPARLAVPFPKVNAFRRYVRARSEIRPDGTVWVAPTGEDQSSLMTTIVDADCLIEIPPLKEGYSAGQPVMAVRLGERS